MTLMFACSRCGCVGFHSEACIAAASAERIAAASQHVWRIDRERLARALAATKGYTPELNADIYGDAVPDYLDAPHEWFDSSRSLADAIADAYEKEDA